MVIVLSHLLLFLYAYVPKRRFFPKPLPRLSAGTYLCPRSDLSHPWRNNGDQQHHNGQGYQTGGNRSSKEHRKIASRDLKRLAQPRFGLSAQHECNDHGGQRDVPDPEDISQDSKTNGQPYIERVVAQTERPNQRKYANERCDVGSR
jgi:hypothetical protein